MRNVSNAYKQMLYYDQRNYICTLNITLADGTKLTVNNDNIMDGGIEVDDAISEDGDFTALGSTVIRGCTVTLYNNNEMYSDYEFKDAKVIVKINLRGADASDEIQLGEFTVDEPTYGDFAITLSLLDNMYQFDRGYASYNIYTSNTTLYDIVVDACTKCGVLYDSSMTNFPNRNFVVPQAPKDKTTYREVLGWCATLAGCFARITDDGKLIFQWFNTDAFDADDESSVDGGVFDSASPYATGDNVNGGTFNPWNDPASKDGGTFTERNGIHYITALNTQNIGVDDVVVTGIRVTYDIEEENSVESVTRLRGTDDYVIDINDNPFITNDNYVAVLNFLQPILIGLQFRTCNVTHPNDPTIQAGDVGYIWDSKGAQHRILITRATFNPTNLQTIVCSAKSPVRNSSARLSTTSKALAKSTRRLNEEKAIREQLEEDFARRIADSAGLYWTKVNNSGGGYTVYAHDKQLLADSSTVLKINSGAIATTGNYTGDDSTTQWFGFEFDGVWLANIISTIGIDFDWGVGGKLTIQDKNGNETFFADADTGIVRIKATEFSLTDGTTLASVKNSAISSAKSYTDTQLGNYKDTVDAVVANLQSQIDGQVMTWYYDYEPTMNNKPASDWTTTALREQHEGDVFYWKSKGYAYRFMKSGSTWGWTLVQDTDITAAIAKAENAQDTADHKRRVFVTQPVPPYDIGDLWTQGSSGDLYRCETARASGSYVAGDWKKATKYTDDSTFTAFRDGTYATFVTNTNSGIQTAQNTANSRITTYYQASQPTAKATGDLWIDTDDGNKLYRWNGSQWKSVQDTAIQTALTNAADAQSTADSKIVTFAQASQPTATDTGDLWIDTNDNNKMYRWSGSSWVRVTDNSGLKAFQDGTYATFVTNTNSALNKKVTTFYQTGQPTASTTGDLWIDTDDGNKLYRWDGSSWKSIQDTAIQSALTAAGDAQSTADKKIVTFAQASQPTATDTGDLWIDTDDNNKMYRWNGSAWKHVTDNSGLKAFQDGTYATFVTSTNTAIGSKITTYYQASAPSSANKGDLWIDTDDSNKLYRYNGSSWVSVRDSGIQTAITAAGDAQATADSKIITFAQASQPTATDVGDLWIDTDANNKMYRWSGTQWVAYTDTSALQTWINGAYASTIQTIRGQIDGKAETYHQSADPSDNWTSSEYTAHTGDLWYDTSDGTTYYWNGAVWVSQNVPDEVFDAIDGKAQIFVSTPTTPYNVGDLWFNSATSDIMTCINARASGNYTASDWQKRNKYTDDTAVTALNTALDQEEIFNRLTNNGQAQGIYMQNGKLYLNFDYAVGQTLKLGGNNNANGLLKIYNSSGVEVGQINNGGLRIKSADGVYEARLDSGGLDLYYNNVYTGTFASGYSASDVNSRLISTTLGEHSTDNGIAWGAWSEEQQINIVKFYYAKVANIFPDTENEEDTLNADCDLDMHSNKIKNTRMVDPKWRLDDISTNGTSRYLYVKGATSDSTMTLTFRHGILVGYSADSSDTSPV